ncbi:MAG: hypothetical protein JWO15_821 [Sphingomonadales bacterium]|nr:hypothetical protein [Sphingomonadales bacterium]
MAEVPDVPETSDRTLNRMVGATVVVLSVLLTIGNIKDGNIVQNMQGDQASKIDLWNEYQATKIKAHLSEDTAAMLAAMGKSPESAAATKTAARYHSESKGLQDQAKTAEADYDVQGRRDDQFDLAERLHVDRAGHQRHFGTDRKSAAVDDRLGRSGAGAVVFGGGVSGIADPPGCAGGVSDVAAVTPAQAAARTVVRKRAPRWPRRLRRGDGLL